MVEYLPYFQMNDESYSQITPRQILSHTSGIPDMEDIEYSELIWHPDKDDGAAERFVRGLKNRSLITPPGECFSYSNIAYNLLGDLIAKVSGQSFEDYMRKNILTPLGMTSSTFLLSDVPTDKLAWPHLRSPLMKVNPIYPYHRADAPSSSLHTTVEDLCKLGITCLNRGVYKDQRILSGRGYDLMWTPVVERSSHRPSIYEKMGLGWTLGHFLDEKTVSHGGAGFGGTAFLLIIPEKNFAAVVLCNQESDAHFRVVQEVAKVSLGHRPQSNTVSWMVPISRALAQGGINAAYDCYDQIKNREDDYNFGKDDLLSLSLQLFTAKKVELAIAILGLNIHVYPEYIESYIQQAKLYLWKSKTNSAQRILLNALSIDPDNSDAAKLLKVVQ